MNERNGAVPRGTDRAREQPDAESGGIAPDGDGPQANDATDIDLLKRVLRALGGTPPSHPPMS